MQKVLFFIAAAFLVVVSAQNAANSSQLKCYFCDSANTPECEKKPSNTLKVSCDDLIYDDSDSRSGIPSGRSQNKYLTEIFKRESSRSLGNDLVEYRCITAGIVENGNKNFIRTCAPLRANVVNVCEFMRGHVEERIKIKECFDCLEDYCNSAFSFNASLFIQFISAIFVWFLAKF